MKKFVLTFLMVMSVFASSNSFAACWKDCRQECIDEYVVISEYECEDVTHENGMVEPICVLVTYTAVETRCAWDCFWECMN